MVDDKPPEGGNKIVGGASTANSTKTAQSGGSAYEAAASAAARPATAEQIMLLAPKIRSLSISDIVSVLNGSIPADLLLSATDVPRATIRALVEYERERRYLRGTRKHPWAFGLVLAAASFGLGVTIALLLG